MHNQYLEKIAASYVRKAVEAGVMTPDALTMSNSKARAAMGLGDKGTHQVISGGQVFKPGTAAKPGVMGTSFGATPATPGRMVGSTATHSSGDSLAASSIRDRLAQHRVDISNGKARKPVAAAPLPGGPTIRKAPAVTSKSNRILDHINKGVSWAKGNPVKAAIGLGAAGLGLMAVKNRNQGPQY